jgi:hypothetical protein
MHVPRAARWRLSRETLCCPIQKRELFLPRSAENGCNAKDTFLIPRTVALPRLSAEITTQLPLGGCWQRYEGARELFSPVEARQK